MRSLRKSIPLFLFLLPATVLSQSGTTRVPFDSLYERAMAVLSKDTVSAMNLLRGLISDQEFLTDFQRARVAYLQLKIREKTSRGNAVGGMGQFPLPASGKNTDSLALYAAWYLDRSMPDRAIELLMNMLELLPQNSDAADLGKIRLCEAYRQKQEYRKGVDLINSLLERPVPLSPQNLAYAYSRMAALYNEWGDPHTSFRDSVLRYSILCNELSQKIGYKPTLASSQNELSFQYQHKGEYDKALELSKSSVSNFVSAGMPFYAMNALINQSNIFIGKKDYHAALGALDEATRMAPIWENRNLYMRIYQQYALIYKLLGEYREGFDFLSIYNNLQVDFFKDRINAQITEQSARYDLLLKEQKIRAEQKKNDYNRRQIILLIILSVTITCAFVFSLFYFRLKRKGAEKQRLIDAVVETESNERRRIARDLHDGLGPVLSAINHYFQAFLDAKPENKGVIQSRLQMVIAEAIDEVSRISHNISPHVLEKHGLITAINNLVAPLAAGGRFEVLFTCGYQDKLDAKIELTVYRCITELLNNTMKHAEATRIILEIKRANDQLMINYSDNGKGFETTGGPRTGMGLHNITNRVESSGGTLMVVSSAGTGTSVSINLPL